MSLIPGAGRSRHGDGLARSSPAGLSAGWKDEWYGPFEIFKLAAKPLLMALKVQ